MKFAKKPTPRATCPGTENADGTAYRSRFPQWQSKCLSGLGRLTW